MHTTLTVRQLWRLGLLGAWIAATLMPAGCAVAAALGVMADTYKRTGSREVFAEYDGLRGKSFAVIVAADRSIQASDPRMVSRLTNSITGMIVGERESVGFTGFVPGPRVLEFQYNTPSWASWSYERLAEEFVVDRLILVDLYEYRLHEPGNPHTWEGIIAGRVGVIEADTGSDDFAFQKEIRVRFPDAPGYTARDISPSGMRATLEQRFVNRVSWLFFDHEEANMLEY